MINELTLTNLSSEDAGIINELAQKLDISAAKRLTKGQERKFYIETAHGEKRMLRIHDIACYWIEADSRMYEYVAASGIPITRPLATEVFADGKLIYQYFTWLEGEDLIDALPCMNLAEQFETGVKCGKLMRKLHTLPLHDVLNPEPWWEFWLTPNDLNSSPHFYSGQIKGYFGGEPPSDFFRYFAYYNVYTVLEFLDDADVHDEHENIRTILNWFDDMQNPVPVWYLSE